MEHYKALGDHIKKLNQAKMLRAFSSNKFGRKVNREDIEIIDPNHYADIDPNESFYFYDGPLDEKTRNFCVEMLIQGKLYTQEEMDYLSSLLGYNVELYCGSFNCRHQWKRARVKGKIQDGTLDQSVIAKGSDARKASKAQSPELKNR